MPNSHTLDQNLQRLITARTSIADAITAKGGTVSQGDGFEEFPSDIATIPAGSGSLVKLTLLPSYTNITEYEFYIFEGETGIYCCGYFAGDHSIGFSVPQDFDMNKIGTVYNGVYNSSSNSSGSTRAIVVDKTNRTITFMAGAGNVSRIAMIAFYKSTS